MTTRNFRQLGNDMRLTGNEVQDAINVKLPRLIGHDMVDGFKKSFKLQRFNDTGTAPWKQVKRRDPESGWYGFNYRGEKVGKTLKYNRKDGTASIGRARISANGKWKKLKEGERVNFSKAATTRNILLGSGSTELRDSIILAHASAGRIIIASDQPHASVHNEGGEAKIFGGKSFRMPKRQFMGESSTLRREAFKTLDTSMRKIFQQ